MVKVETGLIDKYPMSAVQMNPGLVPSCSYVTATDQVSVCCIGMDSDMQLLPNFFGPCGQRHGSRFA